MAREGRLLLGSQDWGRVAIQESLEDVRDDPTDGAGPPLRG